MSTDCSSSGHLLCSDMRPCVLQAVRGKGLLPLPAQNARGREGGRASHPRWQQSFCCRSVRAERGLARITVKMRHGTEHVISRFCGLEAREPVVMISAGISAREHSPSRT